MRYHVVHQIYFSPTGTTQRVINEIGNQFLGEKHTRDLLLSPFQDELALEGDDVVIVGVPVYSGRVPEICLESLSLLKGNKTPAIIAVVYGNREYEDALLELKDILEKNGFIVIAAGAFIGQHSIVSKVASGRPDQEDLKEIAEFGQACVKKIAFFSDASQESVSVKGSFPYRDRGMVPFHPQASDACIECGTCAEVCPTGAISPNDPHTVDEKICIACGACIKNCTVGARSFRGDQYDAFAKTFSEKFQARKEPEIFL